MAKLCPKGKAAAKRKFKVYPSGLCKYVCFKSIVKAKLELVQKTWWFHCTRLWQSNVRPKKENKDCLMGDLKKWVNEKWVDIGAPKKDGKYQPCGRKSSTGSKRKYPKCVPLAKATRMTKGAKGICCQTKKSSR